MSLGVAGIVLGEVAIILDLGNRLFGSYARTSVGAAWRIVFVVLVCVALASPGVFLLLDPASKAARFGMNLCGILGALGFVHFLFPYRWGIKRVQPRDSAVEITALTKGVVLRTEVWRSRAVPPAVDGLSILVISDLHCNTAKILQTLREAVTAVGANPVDLAFMLGDFGENRSLLPEVVRALKDIPSRFGTYCVRGNHDFEHGRDTLVRELLAENGLTLLPNEAKHWHQLSLRGLLLLIALLAVALAVYVAWPPLGLDGYCPVTLVEKDVFLPILTSSARRFPATTLCSRRTRVSSEPDAVSTVPHTKGGSTYSQTKRH